MTAPAPPGPDPTAPRIRAAATAGLCAAMRRAGAEPDAVLGRFHLSEGALEEPSSWLDLADYCGLLEQSARRCGNAAFGWELGLAQGTGILGDIAEVVATAPTLGAGLAAVSRCFGALQEQTAVTLDRRDGDAALSYQVRDGRIVHRRQDAELSLGALIALLRGVLGERWTPEEIHVEHATRDLRGLPESLRGARLCVGRRRNAILIPGPALGALVPTADPCRHGAVVRRIERRLADRRGEDFVGAVTQQIRDALADGKPGLAPVARRLGLSGPALYRRLSACGVDYSDLRRDLRRELALGALADPQLPLTEVALMLGYSELSAFSRAFRGWSGLAPLAYRRRHLAS